MEILATVLTVLVYTWTKMDFQNAFLLATQNYTTLYIPLAAMWILLFNKKQGLITKVLTNKVTVYIGNISAYLFLIHYVVTRYFGSGLDLLDVQIDGWEHVGLILIELVLSVLATILYKKFLAPHVSCLTPLEK